MKVKELIEYLSALNPDAEVVLQGYEGGHVTLERGQIVPGELYRNGDLGGMMGGGSIEGPHLFNPDGGKLEQDDAAFVAVGGISPEVAVLFSREVGE